MNHQQPVAAGWQGEPAPASGERAPQAVLSGPAHHPIADMLRVLRRGSRGLILWILFCAALTAVYLYRAVPEYVATTQIVLEPRRPLPGTPDNNGSTLDSAQADSQVQVVKSERNLRFVFDTLGLANNPVFASERTGLLSRIMGSAAEVSPEQRAALKAARAFQAFSDRVSVRRIGQSYALEVSFRAPTGVMAARLANSVTAAYIRDQIAFRAAAVQRGTEFLQGRIADIKAEQDIAVDAVLKGIIPDTQFAHSDARVVSGATEPLSKAFPQPLLFMLLALIFGVLSGVGVLAVRHSLDRRIGSREQIGQALGVDCIGVLPRVQGRRGKRQEQGDLSYCAVLERPASDYAEALRVLRTAILSAHKSSRHVAFGIVSWSPGEGRSTLASNLAFLIASSREGIALIDGDFRDPALTRMLAPDAPSGLSEILLNHASGTQLSPLVLDGGLAFIPAVGAGRDSDMTAYIGSAEMEQVLLTLRQDRDVIVDLAPLSTSSDAQAIGPMLDGVVLVVEAHRTTVDDVSEAIRALRASNTKLIGLVLNKLSVMKKGPRRAGPPLKLERSSLAGPQG